MEKRRNEKLRVGHPDRARLGRRLRAGGGNETAVGRKAHARNDALLLPNIVVHGDAAADGLRVLYGGSVKAANVAGIMEKPDVDFVREGSSLYY